MSKIEISNRDAVYILQAMRYWISVEAKEYQQLNLQTCSESEIEAFNDHQLLLNDLLNVHVSLINNYKENFVINSNMIDPETFNMDPETLGLLRKFFPLMSKDNF